MLQLLAPAGKRSAKHSHIGFHRPLYAFWLPPPVVRILVIATSGAFTGDAVPGDAARATTGAHRRARPAVTNAPAAVRASATTAFSPPRTSPPTPPLASRSTASAAITPPTHSRQSRPASGRLARRRTRALAWAPGPASRPVRLAEIVLGSSAVPARKDQRNALQPLLDAFFAGLGDQAVEVLSANLDRAGLRLVRLVETEQRRFMTKPRYDQVVQINDFDPVRTTDKTTSGNRHGASSKATAYEGWQRSIFPLA
jgi:hypothetical protein